VLFAKPFYIPVLPDGPIVIEAKLFIQGLALGG
jgi:hypothetical protein